MCPISSLCPIVPLVEQERIIFPSSRIKKIQEGI